MSTYPIDDRTAEFEFDEQLIKEAELERIRAESEREEDEDGSNQNRTNLLWV